MSFGKSNVRTIQSRRQYIGNSPELWPVLSVGCLQHSWLLVFFGGRTSNEKEKMRQVHRRNMKNTYPATKQATLLTFLTWTPQFEIIELGVLNGHDT